MTEQNPTDKRLAIVVIGASDILFATWEDHVRKTVQQADLVVTGLDRQGIEALTRLEAMRWGINLLDLDLSQHRGEPFAMASILTSYGYDVRVAAFTDDLERDTETARKLLKAHRLRFPIRHTAANGDHTDPGDLLARIGPPKD